MVNSITLVFTLLLTITPSLKDNWNNTPVEVTENNQTLFQFLSEKDEVIIHVSDKLKTIEKNFEKDQETVGSIDIMANNETYTFTATFEPGGKTRRKICRMPPLKMNLKKSELEDKSFLKGNDKMKIVFQCNTSKSMAESIKKEKFIYDLYGLITDYGHHAKMVKVKIADDKKYVEGFILEDEDDLEVRTNTKELKNKTISPEVIDRDIYIKMCLFQFMISNADWSARKGHNTKLYKRNSDNSLVVIPYDFDYSGLIDNDYAIPPQNLPIEDVTHRYFMDKMVKMEELKKGIEYYKGIESDIYELCDNSTYLSESSRKRIKKFIEGYYKIIKDDKKVGKMLKRQTVR